MAIGARYVTAMASSVSGYKPAQYDICIALAIWSYRYMYSYVHDRDFPYSYGTVPYEYGTVPYVHVWECPIYIWDCPIRIQDCPYAYRTISVVYVRRTTDAMQYCTVPHTHMGQSHAKTYETASLV